MAYDDNETRVEFNYVFGFEKDFEYERVSTWLRHNWTQSFVYATIYVIVVFYAKNAMRDRAGFELRKPLFLWNLGLAIFSVFGACRFVAEMWHVWSKFGFQFTICNASYHRANVAVGFWSWMFILSKVVELGDTLFVVLRKRPLMFLHWYHHITVLLYTWYTSSTLVATGRWFVTMNYVVHSFMYSYYALRAADIAVPKPVAMMITSTQLLQMVVGLFANLWAYDTLIRGEFCENNLMNIRVSLLMYLSYFMLFARYFVKSYVRRRVSKSTKVN